MSVSTIIAVYNGAAYLQEALKSVLHQTHPPAEIIVVDDGSTDATPAIVAAIPHPLVYIRQENQGVAVALNTGIQRATAKYISFLDADDLWAPLKLAAQVAFLDEHRAVDGVFGYARQFVSPELNEDERRQLDCPTEPQPAWVKGTALLRAETFDRVGLFDPVWRVGEFIDWYLRAQAAGITMVMQNDLVMSRRWHKSNLTANTTRDNLVDYARIVQAERRRQRGDPRESSPQPLGT
jgi:glycosyltransferase involved in cell wall biosynthesis